MSSVYLACPGDWKEDYIDSYAYRTTAFSYISCSVPMVERTTEADSFRCDSGATPYGSLGFRCDVPWIRLSGATDSGATSSQSTASILVCDGDIQLTQSVPSCSTGWTASVHTAPFSVSQIEPATAGAFFGSGFFLCLIPLAAAWGFSQLLNMITWR